MNLAQIIYTQTMCDATNGTVNDSANEVVGNNYKG